MGARISGVNRQKLFVIIATGALLLAGVGLAVGSGAGRSIRTTPAEKVTSDRIVEAPATIATATPASLGTTSMPKTSAATKTVQPTRKGAGTTTRPTSRPKSKTTTPKPKNDTDTDEHEITKPKVRDEDDDHETVKPPVRDEDDDDHDDSDESNEHD